MVGNDPAARSRHAALSATYTRRALQFIREAHAEGRRFLLYYPTHLPHTPLVPSDEVAGSSPACGEPGVERPCGPFADVLLDLDASVGAIAEELASLGIDRETLMVFTSDKGPWLEMGIDSGSAGSLRGGKGRRSRADTGCR